MNTIKLSVAEIIEIAKNAKEQGIDPNLPSSKPGVADRAEREGWEFEVVPAKGGKGGVKKIYTLPHTLLEELKAKGLLHLFDKPAKQVENDTAKPHRPYLKTVKHATGEPVASFMQPMVTGYDDWAEQQNTDSIVPVRYHTNVFGSAGNGYEVLEEVNTEAMWFRRSFFDVLGVPPARCFCTCVKGNSMHPTLTDGGTVLWQMTSRYTSEGIYLFRQVGELRIKRLQQINGFTFRIISDNPNDTLYPITDLDLREMQDYEFEIYGRHLWDCSIKL